jgi:hypothetical protein
MDQNLSPELYHRIATSAKRLGIEFNEQELEKWIERIVTPTQQSSDILIQDTGVFGHKVTMLDFSPQELERFRKIGKIVEFDDVPGIVETALALSGSAAQSKIQTHPGDCDYFERVNIIAPTQADASKILADIMHEKALSSLSGENYQLTSVSFGGYPTDVIRNGKTKRKGAPIKWDIQQIKTKEVVVTDLEGNPLTITWDSVMNNPGWCKLDWIVVDETRGQLSNASNVLDVTWEAPDGTLYPLDGYLDGYFQEVYLDIQSIPIFTKLVKQLSTDSIDRYIEQLHKEVTKYTTGDKPNYGKAAKRLYNILRLNGQYEAAALMRELFDEPMALLYQVHAMIKTIQEAAEYEHVFATDSLLEKTENLILSAARVLSGEEEQDIIRYLLRCYRCLLLKEVKESLADEVKSAQDRVMKVLNQFFYDKMTAIPEVKIWISA